MAYARASLARKIIRRRQAVGMTQVQLARLCRMPKESLCRIERGNVTPSVATVEKIVRALERVEGKQKPKHPMPPRDRKGNDPAAEALQVSIPRSLMRRRRAAGLTKAELARRAGIRPETLGRIEQGKHAASVRTIDKIDAALCKAEEQDG